MRITFSFVFINIHLKKKIEITIAVFPIPSQIANIFLAPLVFGSVADLDPVGYTSCWPSDLGVLFVGSGSENAKKKHKYNNFKLAFLFSFNYGVNFCLTSP